MYENTSKIALNATSRKMTYVMFALRYLDVSGFLKKSHFNRILRSGGSLPLKIASFLSLDKQVVCMRGKLLFTIFVPEIFKFLKYAN